VFQLIEALANGDGKLVVAISETLRLHGLNSASTLEDMSSVLQRMAVLQAVGNAPEADTTDPEAADIERLASLMPADETQLLYSLCIHGRQELGLAPDEYAALTMVLLRLLAFKPKSPSDAITASPIASAPAEKKTSELVAAPPPATAPILAKTSEGDFWNQLVREMVEAQAINALVRELALQSQLMAREDQQWTLQVDKDSLNTPSNRERLQAALAQFGHDVQLRVVTGAVQDSTSKRLTQENAQRQAQAEAIILQDPFVQSLMRDFDAKIVPGSIKPV
jgi:DNA polymerase-3 subunit gamma/tau